MTSLVEEAAKNLRKHGVDVEIPTKIEGHNQINSMTESMLAAGLQKGAEAASYKSFNDRIDIYMPLAKSIVVKNLNEDEREEIEKIMEENPKTFNSRIRKIKTQSEVSQSDMGPAIKIDKLKYAAAATEELNSDDELREQVTDRLREEVLHDTEHELVHASHYQHFMDNDIEPLEEEFENYIRDIENVRGDNLNADRRVKEGISNPKDVEFATAINMLDEEDYQNIVEMGTWEVAKWEKKARDISRKYSERAEKAKKPVEEKLEGFEAEFSFDQLTSIFSGTALNQKPEDVSVEEVVEKMEEEGVEEYEIVKEQVGDRELIIETLEEVEEIYEGKDDEVKPVHRNMMKAEDHLKEAIRREAKLQGDFEEHIEQYADRLETAQQVPGDFTEAFAQFWTAYRKDQLESEQGREEVYERLEGYDKDGLEDTMDDLFNMYDSLEGSQEERVTDIMSNQMEYLEGEYSSGDLSMSDQQQVAAAD